MPYTSEKPGTTPDSDTLRERIPGWGADLDPADRPAFPREQPGIPTGAHWDLPPAAVDGAASREVRRAHAPDAGVRLGSAAARARRVSSAASRTTRYSEGQTAHWLLLIVGDRVDAITSHVTSLVSRRPDDPITESGVLGERGHRPFSSRFGKGRIDLKHAWLDPLIVVGPWLLVIGGLAMVGKSIVGLAGEENRLTDGQPALGLRGRNMFGPVRGEWTGDWRGWWGPDPPYHRPVFVLTHHPRESLEMEGGTTFHFVTDGIEAALERAQDATDDRQIHVAGGVSTINQYLAAGLIDELMLQIAPAVVGDGLRLFEGVGRLDLEQVSSRPASLVTHVRYRVRRPGSADRRGATRDPAPAARRLARGIRQP